MTLEMVVILVLGLFFALVSALVSAVETAIAILEDGQRKRLLEGSPLIARIMEAQKDHPRRLENALLLANTLANLPLIILCLMLLSRMPTAFTEWGSAFIVFGAVIFFCEIVPKMAAMAYPYWIARCALPMAAWVSATLAPVCLSLQRFCEHLVGRLIPVKPYPSNALTDEELRTLITLAHEEGNLQLGESEMIRDIMKLAHENVKHCMTPRVDIISIPDDLANEEVAARLQAQRFRRVLVQGASPDDIVGILEVRRFFLNSERHYIELVDPPSFIPETMNALELLRSFLNRKQAMAILVDEYGGIEGIVTLSDLVEEIMSNALPTEQNELYIERLADGRVLVSGSTRLDDLAPILGFELHGEGVETIGGLVMSRVGHLPREGMRVPLNNWEIVVRRATRKRIKELVLEYRAPSPSKKQEGEK
ncbi:MAG: CNNM domain-containing protein [Chthoniobacterales bacterium]